MEKLWKDTQETLELVTCKGWRTGMGEKLFIVYFIFYIFELVNVYLSKISLKKNQYFLFLKLGLKTLIKLIDV